MLRDDEREFIVQYLKDTNRRITIWSDGKEIEIESIAFMPMLESYTKNLRHKINGEGCKIYGADKVGAFVVCCAGNDHVERLAKKIWEKPEDFWDLTPEELESDGGWDSFLKYLWIDGWHSTYDVRLADFVENMEEMKKAMLELKQ